MDILQMLQGQLGEGMIEQLAGQIGVKLIAILMLDAFQLFVE